MNHEPADAWDAECDRRDRDEAPAQTSADRVRREREARDVAQFVVDADARAIREGDIEASEMEDVYADLPQEEE
jgi:hypothetical protein